MPKFRVKAKMVSYPYAIVEAETEEEALEKANQMDGGDFTPDESVGGGYWEIVEAEEVTEE